MQNTPDREAKFGARDTSLNAVQQKPGSRSAAAAWEFLKALAGDFSAFANHLRDLFLTAHTRWRRRLATHNPVATSSAVAPASAGARPAAGGARTTARGLRRLVFGIIIAGTGGLLILCCALLWALLGLPVDRAGAVADKPTLLLEAANGDPLGRVGVFTVADQPMQNFPAVLIQAVLSTEDRRFYRHPGVDPLGILRAVHANRAAGEVVEGGSTITQQLVKMEYLTSDRTYIRKLREALMAMWLETHLSKDQILDRYLNRVYLGDGAYGMAAASQLYFNKRPADLTLAEAAMLAGLVKAPSELDPLHHLNAARARAATVLDAMVADHVIDEKAANPPRRRRPRSSFHANSRRLGPGLPIGWQNRPCTWRARKPAACACAQPCCPICRIWRSARSMMPWPSKGANSEYLRERWWRCVPMVRCWRWSVAGTMAAVSSTVRSMPTGNPAPPSSHLFIWPLCARATRRKTRSTPGRSTSKAGRRRISTMSTTARSHLPRPLQSQSIPRRCALRWMSGWTT